MNSNQLETNQPQTQNNGYELVLKNDEVEQLAKFLDALLESDLADKNYGGNDND